MEQTTWAKLWSRRQQANFQYKINQEIVLSNCWKESGQPFNEDLKSMNLCRHVVYGNFKYKQQRPYLTRSLETKTVKEKQYHRPGTTTISI